MIDARQLPEQSPRMETGAVQFGDDWPGTFFRGDDSFHFAVHLNDLLRKAEEKTPKTAEDFVNIAVCKGLASTLMSCMIKPIKK